MADIFISYAHEDQPFVLRMVQALETEGFSVWWDHTIPPGQSWDSFIARGINEAKAAIVVWSTNSVGSEWVKEEAQISRGSGKYLPVQIDGAVPPMGFSRIQAANLSSWSGDRDHPQWQMLLREARNLSSADRVENTPGRAPVQSYYPPQPQPAFKSKSRGALVGLVAAVAVLGVAAYLLTNQTQSASTEQTQFPAEPSLDPPTTQVAATTTAQPQITTVVQADPAQQAEIERLRRERDSAIAAAQQAVRATQHMPATTVQQQSSPLVTMVGTWRYSFNGNVGADKVFTSDGRTHDPDDGAGSWSVDGNHIRIVYDTRGLIIEGTLSGNTMVGTYRFGGSSQGQVSMSRR